MKINMRTYMAIAILVVTSISVFQLYWLYSIYQEHKTQTLKEMNTCIKEYVLENMENLIDKKLNLDTIIEVEEIEKLKLVKGLIKDISNISNSNYNISLNVIDGNDSILKNISLDSVKQVERNLTQDIHKVFVKNDLEIEYDVTILNGLEFLKTSNLIKERDKESELKSDSFSLNGTTLHFYVSTKHLFLYLVGKMKLSILFSVILILLSAFVFVIFFKTVSKQIKLNQFKNDFVNNMTHELKTPLATCSAALESIEKFNVIDNKETTLKYINLVQNQIQRIQTLIDVILTSSSVENKKLMYQFEKVNLKEIIQGTINDFELQLKEQDVTLSAELPSESVFLNADRLHLSQVVSNVLDNAIKYNCIKGQITIKLVTKDKTLLLQISNTGKGFPQEFENKVFDKFFRLSTNNIHNVKGYGLGLNYSRHVIEAHKGSISITSGINQLTILTIKLPKYE